jgi:hypothetical protein
LKLRSPAIIVIVGGFVAAHGLGIIDAASKVLGALDQSANSIVDMRKVLPQIGTVIPIPAPAKQQPAINPQHVARKRK